MLRSLTVNSWLAWVKLARILLVTSSTLRLLYSRCSACTKLDGMGQKLFLFRMGLMTTVVMWVGLTLVPNSPLSVVSVLVRAMLRSLPGNGRR